MPKWASPLPFPKNQKKRAFSCPLPNHTVYSGNTFHQSVYPLRFCYKKLQKTSCNPDAGPVEINEKEDKRHAEYHSRYKSSDISALIGRQQLQKAVKHHRNHQQKHIPKLRYSPKNCNGYSRYHADKLPCTPGTDGKLLPTEEKGTVRSCMAAEHNL